jgi:2,3-bisphosphoglycerate-dependent phosphoglycerate mutase
MLHTLYLVRHGNPKLGTGIAYDRVPGPPLDTHGHDEAHAAATYLSGVGLNRMLSSPLDRAAQTAEAIAAETGLAVEIDPLLAEQRNDETFSNVRVRAFNLFERVKAGPAATVAMVTHGAMIKAMLLNLSKDTLDLSRYTFPNGNHAPTAGVWVAERAGDDWRLELVFEPKLATF